MRRLKTTYPEFASSATIQKENFRSVLQGSKGKLFDDKFFDMVDRRRSETTKTQHTLIFLQLPTFIYLVLVLAGNDVNLSMFGITAGKNLREAFVLISSMLGLWSMALTVQQGTFSSILQVRNERLAKGDKEAIEFLNAGYEISPIMYATPISPYLSTSSIQKFVVVVFALSVFILLLGVLAIVVTVHVMTVMEIYRHPNFSPTPTAIVIGAVLLCDAISISWLFVSSGAVPYRSSERLMRWAKFSNSNPKRSDEMLTQVILEQRRKNWLMRRLTSPKLPTVPEK